MNSDELQQRLSNFNSVHFCGHASDASIIAAEEQLGIRFPPQYRSFLSAFGCGRVNSEQFIGLGGPDYMDIVKETLWLRNQNNSLPPHLLPIRGDGYGNYDCFDTRHPTSQGEYRIVQWNHEGGYDQECEHLADTFDAWFESILVMMEENA